MMTAVLVIVAGLSVVGTVWAMAYAERAGRRDAARVCESRARSLAGTGQHVAANEAQKCANAIRRGT